MAQTVRFAEFLDVRIMAYLDTALRIPPLFLMDELLKWSCGFSRADSSVGRYDAFSHEETTLFNEEDATTSQIENLSIMDGSDWQYLSNLSDSVDPSTDDFSKMAVIPILGKIFCFIVGLLLALVIFLLNWNKLLKVYSVILSFFVIVLSYQANMTSIKIIDMAMHSAASQPLLQSMLSLNSSAVWDSGGITFSIAFNYFVQGILGLIFTALVPITFHSILRVLIILNFLIPSFCLALPFPPTLFTSIPVFTALLPLCILKFLVISHLNHCFVVVVEGYQYARMVLRHYGLHSLLESEWVRLNVPNVLRVFWLLRTSQHISVLLSEYMYMKGEYQSLLYIQQDDLFLIFKSVLVRGCETSVALLGMTSVVSYISHYISILFQAILMSDDDDERSMGTVCAILFFVLAQQGGLTVLDGEKRFLRLCRNFSFLFAAMLHFTHNMVNPVLMSLSASHNPALHRHARALFVCVILITFPCGILYILWNQCPLSTWLLAVSAFSVQVIVKTVVSLLIYSLFLFDAYQNTFWECLDDYVYYIKAFGNSVEFVLGILLFFTGAWIYLFESGGTIRAIMMCIHAYFNIWCEAKSGWNVFMKRRTAVNKINSLPEATLEQLERHSDVCAICFQELLTAKITCCKHFFHSVCLRKWLYVQDSCPLCHETLYKPKECSPEGFPQREGSPEPDVSHTGDGATDSVDIIWEQEDIGVILGEATTTEDASREEPMLPDNSEGITGDGVTEGSLRCRRPSENKNSGSVD